MGIWDDIVGIGETIVDAGGDVVDALTDAAGSLFEGPGGLVGVMTAGTALLVAGPGMVVPALIGGTAAGNALIRHRHMRPDERAFAEQVFGASLPPNDRIVLTNLTGLKGAKFVCPNIAGDILVNLGPAYDNPTGYADDKYPSPGKVLIHELTHVWQIHHARFVPGLVCEGIGNQIGGAPYRPGQAGRPWSTQP